MKGRINEFVPHMKQRLLVRYAQVDAVATPVEGAEDIAFSFAGKYDIVVACGGDGTLHEVINGVMKSGFQPIIAVFPFGTCNDVARTLNIPFDLDKAIEEYKGAVLMVSHDFYNIVNVADYVLFVDEKCMRPMRIRSFRKKIYENHFSKEYLELEQKKKELETRVSAALKAKDFKTAKKISEQLEEVIGKMK